MPVIRFPRPSTPAARMVQVEAFARSRALSVRFAGQPTAAVRWAREAAPIDVDLALAADATLDLIAVRRIVIEAEQSGDRERAIRMQAVAARIHATIQDIGRTQRVRGWRA